jgi:hypothetical protein
MKNLIKTTKSIQLDKNNIIDYLLIYLLMALSGNKAFGISALMVTFVLAFAVFVYRKRSFDMTFIYLILILTFILLSQSLIFDFFPFITILGFYLRIFMVYFVIKSIGEEFIEKFVKFMVFLALVSLFFFILSNLISEFPLLMKPFALKYAEEVDSADKFSASYYTLFHNFRFVPYSPIAFVRNPSMFWEAGVLGGYSAVTLMLNIMKKGVLFNKQNIILMVAILSTASTSSFVALMALSFFYMLASSEYKILKTILLPFLILISLFMFTYLDFLGAKIEDKIKLAQDPNVIHTRVSSRFVDAIRDFTALQDHELLGRGLNKETRLSKVDKQSSYLIRTNGLSDHLVKFGGIFFILTFILIYFSFRQIINFYKKIPKLFALYSIFILMLILQSETYFTQPFFWGLLLLSTIYKEKKE